MKAPTPHDVADLLDWKREIFELYETARAESPYPEAWEQWVLGRDRLFRYHPSSPLPPAERKAFEKLPYFDHDPAARVLAFVEPTEATTMDIAASAGETVRFTRFATATFELKGMMQHLALYWLEGYGGGLFVPFRDATSGRSTYGAGRYLLDTVKGADLGWEEGRLVLDFNFAYNPSCSYDESWVCPLAPPENRLVIAIEAGERYPQER